MVYVHIARTGRLSPHALTGSPRGEGRGPMQQWEYLTRTLSGCVLGADWLRARLAELGEQGWELITALPVGNATTCDHHTYVFKRPKSGDAGTLTPPAVEPPRPIPRPGRAA